MTCLATGEVLSGMGGGGLFLSPEVMERLRGGEGGNGDPRFRVRRRPRGRESHDADGRGAAQAAIVGSRPQCPWRRDAPVAFCRGDTDRAPKPPNDLSTHPVRLPPHGSGSEKRDRAGYLLRGSAHNHGHAGWRSVAALSIPARCPSDVDCTTATARWPEAKWRSIPDDPTLAPCRDR